MNFENAMEVLSKELFTYIVRRKKLRAGITSDRMINSTHSMAKALVQHLRSHLRECVPAQVVRSLVLGQRQHLRQRCDLLAVAPTQSGGCLLLRYR